MTKKGNLSSWFNGIDLSDMRHRLFPTISKRSLIRHYLPLSGAASHTLLTVNLLAPSVLSRLFPLYDLAVSNALLFQSHVGIGFYVFFRPHLYRLNNWNRVEFSVIASVFFNYGSLLMTIFIKSLLSKRLTVMPRSFVGILLSLFALCKGRKYIQHIDSRTRSFKDVRFEHAGTA